MSYLTNRLTLSVLLLISALALLATGLRPAHGQSSAEATRTIDEVYSLIQERFREETDPEELRNAAIRGMLEYVDDPYTVYIPPVAIRDFDKDVRGEYVGIGAEVDAREGFLRIASPMDGSPAWNAGLEPDDLVVGVDGVSTFGMDINAIIDRLLGEPDTEVVVTIERSGTKADWPDDARPASELETPEADEDGAPFEASPPIEQGHTRFDLTLVRKPIRTITVKGLFRDGEDWHYFADPEDKIAYVRLTQFTDASPRNLERVLRRLERDGMKGLIFDLRYNSGGSLAAAIQISDMFLSKGTIVSTRGRYQPRVAVARRQRNELPDFPMIVLVNEGSASASEIVSGALKDNNRAIVLGERSFGKGSVQSVIPLSTGEGALKITEEYYYLPSGRLLHRKDDSTEWGVDPTEGYYVPMEPEASIEMWRERRAAETLRADAPEGDWSDPAWLMEHLKDPQLGAAVEALRAKIETGSFKKVGGDVPEGTIELAELRLEEERRELFLDELARIERRIDALRVASAGGAEPEPVDLIPDEATLTDGRLEVFDSEGNVVATLKITGDNLEQYLIRAPVAPGISGDRSADAGSDSGAEDNDDG